MISLVCHLIEVSISPAISNIQGSSEIRRQQEIKLMSRSLPFKWMSYIFRKWFKGYSKENSAVPEDRLSTLSKGAPPTSRSFLRPHPDGTLTTLIFQFLKLAMLLLLSGFLHGLLSGPRTRFHQPSVQLTFYSSLR